MIIHTILYVADQNLSRDFYGALFKMSPHLDVPGMTEFKLSEKHILGLMPTKGIKKLLGDKISEPHVIEGTPKVELYIKCNGAEELFQCSLDHGAKLLSPITERDWGDRVGYVMDADGHILAFAIK